MTDGIADRGTNTKNVVCVELGIVLDVVVVDLRADENIGEAVPDIVANAAAKVFHEVIAAGVEGASPSRNAAGRNERAGKTGSGHADAGKDVETKLLADAGLIERVDVSEEGTVGFIDVRVVRPLVSPGDLRVKAETVLELDEVAADAEVSTTLFRGWLKGDRGIARGRGHQGTAAKQDIALLGRGEVAGEKKQTGGSEQSEFFQYGPLFVRRRIVRRGSPEAPAATLCLAL